MQARGGDIFDDLQGALGERFAGVWFDNDVGEFVVPLVAGSGAEEAAQVFAARGLERSYRVASATSTWAELQRTQKSMEDDVLKSLFDEGLARTSILASDNSVVVALAAEAPEPVVENVRTRAASETATVDVRQIDKEHLRVPPLACTFPNCDKPLRGGVRLDASGCTTGFLVYGNVNGQRYILTAGHCVTSGASEAAREANGTYRGIGGIWAWVYGALGDGGIIKVVPGSWWNMAEGSWTPGVVVWPNNQIATQNFHSILATASSYEGLYNCHSGVGPQISWPHTTCGKVAETDVDTTFDDPANGNPHVYGLVTESGASSCIYGGDSGGPYFMNNFAYGITNAGIPGCGTLHYYSPAETVANNMGTHVAIDAVPP